MTRRTQFVEKLYEAIQRFESAFLTKLFQNLLDVFLQQTHSHYILLFVKKTEISFHYSFVFLVPWEWQTCAENHTMKSEILALIFKHIEWKIESGCETNGYAFHAFCCWSIIRLCHCICLSFEKNLNQAYESYFLRLTLLVRILASDSFWVFILKTTLTEQMMDQTMSEREAKVKYRSHRQLNLHFACLRRVCNYLDLNGEHDLERDSTDLWRKWAVKEKWDKDN